MIDEKKIQDKISQFAKDREWEKYHTPKNLVMALSVESSELLEIFQWLTDEEAKNIMQTEKATQVRHEVADTAVYLLRLCDLLGIDISAAIEEKIKLNALKYPVEKSRGNSKKYDEL
jgi:dCTP diphosphatase